MIMTAAALGALAGGAMGIGGGMFSSSSNKKIAQKQMDLQEHLARNAMQIRKKDAELAGFHPLAALGAPSMNVAPIAMEDKIGPALADAGQSVATAAARMKEPSDVARENIDLMLAKSQLAESDARRELYLSEAARNRQAAQTGGGGTLGTGIQLEGSAGTGPKKEMSLSSQKINPPGTGVINVKPVDQASAKINHPEVVAGRHPYWQEFEIHPGMPMLLPQVAGESPAEILNEMSYQDYAGLLMLNSERYGKGWMKDFVRLRYFGQKPEFSYQFGLDMPAEPERPRYFKKYGYEDPGIRYHGPRGKHPEASISTERGGR